MRKALLSVGIVVGILEIIGVALWCVAGAGIYGSPLAGMSRDSVLKVAVFFFVGPILLLPASILARWWPRSAGLLLVLGGLLSAVWHIGVVMSPYGWGKLSSFEAWLPLALVSLPLILIGAAYLCFLRRPTARVRRAEVPDARA